eukprot:TRINITY_DN2388_c0_g1_i1.p1 TRINITY_DN2388_c0_g1~~TRINITY_DN2388_c0_g1_i1.p1  ORF type:complete len:595 (-),score=102.78 TRINITY_DN2388_c0_g1_i1:11-1795(-)
MGHTTKVYLNLYDLDLKDLVSMSTVKAINAKKTLGFGAFHSGIQIWHKEISYGIELGIHVLLPRTSPSGQFRETIYLGETNKSVQDVIQTLEDLMNSRFQTSNYSVLKNNCNDFSNALAQKLVGVGIPSYVNKIAHFMKYCTTLIPEEKLGLLGTKVNGYLDIMDKELLAKALTCEEDVQFHCGHKMVGITNEMDQDLSDFLDLPCIDAPILSFKETRKPPPPVVSSSGLYPTKGTATVKSRRKAKSKSLKVTHNPFSVSPKHSPTTKPKEREALDVKSPSGRQKLLRSSAKTAIEKSHSDKIVKRVHSEVFSVRLMPSSPATQKKHRRTPSPGSPRVIRGKISKSPSPIDKPKFPSENKAAVARRSYCSNPESREKEDGKEGTLLSKFLSSRKSTGGQEKSLKRTKSDSQVPSGKAEPHPLEKSVPKRTRHATRFADKEKPPGEHTPRTAKRVEKDKEKEKEKEKSGEQTPNLSPGKNSGSVRPPPPVGKRPLDKPSITIQLPKSPVDCRSTSVSPKHRSESPVTSTKSGLKSCSSAPGDLPEYELVSDHMESDNLEPTINRRTYKRNSEPPKSVKRRSLPSYSKSKCNTLHL